MSDETKAAVEAERERAAGLCVTLAAKHGFPRDSAEARALCEAAAAIRQGQPAPEPEQEAAGWKSLADLNAERATKAEAERDALKARLESADNWRCVGPDAPMGDCRHESLDEMCVACAARYLLSERDALKAELEQAREAINRAIEASNDQAAELDQARKERDEHDADADKMAGEFVKLAETFTHSGMVLDLNWATAINHVTSIQRDWVALRAEAAALRSEREGLREVLTDARSALAWAHDEDCDHRLFADRPCNCNLEGVVEEIDAALASPPQATPEAPKAERCVRCGGEHLAGADCHPDWEAAAPEAKTPERCAKCAGPTTGGQCNHPDCDGTPDEPKPGAPAELSPREEDALRATLGHGSAKSWSAPASPAPAPVQMCQATGCAKPATYHDLVRGDPPWQCDEHARANGWRPPASPAPAQPAEPARPVVVPIDWDEGLKRYVVPGVVVAAIRTQTLEEAAAETRRGGCGCSVAPCAHDEAAIVIEQRILKLKTQLSPSVPPQEGHEERAARQVMAEALGLCDSGLHVQACFVLRRALASPGMKDGAK